MGGKHTLGLLCHQAYRTLIRVCGHKRVCIIHACATVQCSKQKSLFQNIFYLQGRLQVQMCSANNPRFWMCRLPQSSKVLNMCFYLYQVIHFPSIVYGAGRRIHETDIAWKMACDPICSNALGCYSCNLGVKRLKKKLMARFYSIFE